MNCDVCGKRIDKHSEDELLDCLSKHFELPFVFGNTAAVLGYLTDQRVPWLKGWGQPHIGTGTFVIDHDKKIEEMTFPDVLVLAAKKEMGKKSKVELRGDPTEDAVGEDAPEDTP